MANDPILRLLGLAKKAGRLEIGEEPVDAVCRARQARLVLLAADAAPNTRRRAAHFGEAGSVLCLELPYEKSEIGLSLGRSSCAVLALTDAGFAAAVVERLAARDPEQYGPAAGQLREKAQRTLQRQREQRSHEKNLRRGKRKPWAPPPSGQTQAPSARGKPKAPPSGRPKDQRRSGPGRDRPTHPTAKSGPGGRRLTGKFRHS